MSFHEPFTIYSCDERAPQNIGAFVDLYLNHASDTGENMTHIFAREFRRKTHKILLFVLEECAENSENFRNSVLRKCCFKVFSSEITHALSVRYVMVNVVRVKPN